MEEIVRSYKSHCLIITYPTQGHINPMLQFSKRLQHKGLKVTLVTTRFMFKTMHKVSGSIAVETISDGYDEGKPKGAEFIESYLTRFQKVGSETLLQLIEKLRNCGQPVDCVVYDAFLPWVLDVVKDVGLVGAAFFTQSCAVDCIYYYVHNGEIQVPATAEEKILVPGLSALEVSDLPSFVNAPELYPAIVKLVLNQFSNLDKADWVLCNTFYKLEEEVVDHMAKLLPWRTIGPTIPSTYLDNRLADDRDYDLSIYKPDTYTSIKWLNERQNGSVIYVSFGSLAELGIEQMTELAWALRCCKYYFLWVVRKSEESKLPSNFVAETSVEKGLVVPWCPQLQVLAHQAIGCFVTHCGWNSTLEALSLGVPLVAMPQWTDQSTNAKYVADVWKTGVRVRQDGGEMVSRETIMRCLKEAMEGEKGKEIKKNAVKWRELANEAVDEGGSSDRNINDFVSKLART